ncbi:MAG TPA: hypothetical protein VKA58_06060 [Propionibacteriaceae bacterium]|nr:hypothetical protein [Propionibacteriaceae bacterium]
MDHLPAHLVGGPLAHVARARHPYFGIAGTIFLLVHIPFSYPDQVLRIITRDLPAYQQLYDNRLATLPASRASAPRSSLGASWRSGTRPYEDRRVGTSRGLRVMRRTMTDRSSARPPAVPTDPLRFTTELGEPCDPRNALRPLKTAAKRAGLHSSLGCTRCGTLLPR